MIKAICFDLDGLYFTNKGKKAFHQVLVDLSRDESKVIYVLYKSPEMLDFVTNKMSEQQFWDFVRNYLKISLSDIEFRNLWVKEYEVDSKIKKLIRKLKADGYIICTCSNNNIARVEALQNKFKFLQDFDVTVFSYKTGFVKPQREMFKVLIEKCGLPAKEIIYSDDNPDRIKGASELGINTFVYKDQVQFVEELIRLGVKL